MNYAFAYRSLTLASFSLAIVMATTPLIAQVAEPPSPVQPETVPPTPREVAPLEEKKIDQFADAYLVIEQIHAKAAADLEKTSDPEAANKVKGDAEARIIEAVERSGLQLEEFNQIADLMSVDASLRAKIADRVKQRRGI